MGAVLIAPATGGPAPSVEPAPSADRPRLCALPPESVVADVPALDACAPVPAAEQRDFERAARARYVPSAPGARLEVTFGCDGLGDVGELVFERGEGHGFSLEGRRLVVSESGARADVRGFAFGPDPAKADPKQRRFRLASAELDARQARGALLFARAALRAELREVLPQPATSVSSSSYDFHVLVELGDRAGRRREVHFTGYQGSGEQLRYLALAVVAERLEALFAAAPFVDRAPETEDDALFTERFVAAVPRFDEPFSWWVMERFVALARDLGTIGVARGLLGRMRPEADDRSSLDAQHDALEGLARVLGWDARRTPAGAARSDADAARAYLAECR